MALSRAAASSMARGKPSSWWQIGLQRRGDRGVTLDGRAGGLGPFDEESRGWG